MILACYNNKWRYCLTIRIDVLDYNDLFSIARLYSFNFLLPVVRHYNKDGYNLIYKKAYLVEILNIGFYNIMFDNYILEKLKLGSNNLLIFILGPLIIVWTVPTYTELWLLFDEVGSLTQSNIHRVIYRQQSVGYIFHIAYPRKKSSGVQVKYFSYDYLFF